jgi:hypothetical protein
VLVPVLVRLGRRSRHDPVVPRTLAEVVTAAVEAEAA